MRGDSLRDFYAKTFVVLGLGLLAAAGAVVDYWPANGEWPNVPPVAGLRPAVPAIAQDLTQTIPAPVIPRAARPAVEIVASNSIVPAQPVAEVVLTLDAPPPAPEPIPADFILASIPMDLPVFALALGEPPLVEPLPSGQASEGIQGRVTDVLRRTRDSFKDARTGLRGAWSGVVGAFKRVNPFFNTNQLSFF